MTNDDVLFLSEVLPMVDAPEMEPEFNYAVSHNMREAERIAESINKALGDKPGFKAYNEAIQELREEFANKDDEGNAIFIVNNVNGTAERHYDIPGLNRSDSPFNKAVEKLKEKHNKDFEEKKEQLKFLHKENKQFKPLTINKKFIPKGLSRRAMDAVYLFVEKPKK